MAAKSLYIDFDGTIHKYSKGYADGAIYDPPMENAITSLIRLRDAGFTLTIFTARDNMEDIEEWLIRYWPKGEPYFKIPVTNKKGPATAYIDDRAIRFTNWIDITNYFV